MRVRSIVHVACPVCGYRLRGSTSEGYRCIRCHAQYSTQFMRHVRKQQFKEAIHHHFAVPHTEKSEEQRILIQDEKEEIPRTIETAVREADSGLERYIDISEMDAVPQGPQMPHEVLAPELRQEYPGFPSPEAPARKTKKPSAASAPSRKSSRQNTRKGPAAKGLRKRTTNKSTKAPKKKSSSRRR